VPKAWKKYGRLTAVMIMMTAKTTASSTIENPPVRPRFTSFRLEPILIRLSNPHSGVRKSRGDDNHSAYPGEKKGNLNAAAA